MLFLILQRISFTNSGTFGLIMRVNQSGCFPICVTLEDPWTDNQPFKSCIPAGVYTCRIINSPKFGRTFEVTNVKDRSNILFHTGNSSSDTSGCILLGDGFSYPISGVTFSKVAFSKFLELTDGFSEFQLQIKNPSF